MSELGTQDFDAIERAVQRLKELLPSFRDPSHYCSHDDIAMVRTLERLLDHE